MTANVYRVPDKIIAKARTNYKGNLLLLEQEYNCLVHTNEYFGTGYYNVTFHTKNDYIWFMLRWS